MEAPGGGVIDSKRGLGEPDPVDLQAAVEGVASPPPHDCPGSSFSAAGSNRWGIQVGSPWR